MKNHVKYTYADLRFLARYKQIYKRRRGVALNLLDLDKSLRRFCRHLRIELRKIF